MAAVSCPLPANLDSYRRCVQWPHPTKRGGTAPTVLHRGVYGLGRKKESKARPCWRRDGPLGRPAGKTSVFHPFPAYSHCLPAVRPGGRTLRVGGHGPPTPTETQIFRSSKVVGSGPLGDGPALRPCARMYLPISLSQAMHLPLKYATYRCYIILRTGNAAALYFFILPLQFKASHARITKNIKKL